MVESATPKGKKNSSLDQKTGAEGAPSKQLVLDIGVEIQKEVDGVEMGVLENGIPYLSQRGLASLAGVNAELAVNDKTVPDISVGRCWSDFWKSHSFDTQYGERQQYPHNYPPYYPQAESNPQSPWAYPEAALLEFRKWFRHEYLPTKFPKYILTKSHLLGGQKEALKIANLYQPKQLPKN